MTDPFRFTTIAHAGRAMLGPLGVEAADALIEAACAKMATGGSAAPEAPETREAPEAREAREAPKATSLMMPVASRVMDIGCGKGELLVRAMLRLNARGLGVDPNRAFLAEARARADAAGIGEHLTLIPSVFEPLLAGPRTYGLVLCTGATHAFGDYAPALRALPRFVADGGRAIVGVGYWRQSPAAEYLASFGGREDEMLALDATLDAAPAAGWRVLAHHESTHAEWDAYEHGYAANMRAWVAANPHESDAPAFSQRIESWAAGYQRWGRETMGFMTMVLARE